MEKEAVALIMLSSLLVLLEARALFKEVRCVIQLGADVGLFSASLTVRVVPVFK